MNKKLLIGLASAGLLASSIAGAAQFKITAPHVTSLTGYNHQSLLVFKNHVESRSNGRIEVDIYPSGQLCGSAKECLAGVQAGMFDYFQTTTPELGNYWAPMNAFDLPYMLPNDRIAECVYDSDEFIADVRSNILDNAKDVRLMMVSNSGGWRNIATTNKQVKSPADVKGLKLRTVPAPIQQQLVNELGGAPTPISWPEVYTALSTGVVDGTKNGIVDIIMNNFHESLNYIILDGHAYMGGAWVFNDKKYASFPDDLKRVVIDAVAAQNQYLRAYPKHHEFEAYAAFKKAKGTVYNPSLEEKAAFQKASAPVRVNFEKNASKEGQKWLQRFEQEIATCEAKINSSYATQMK